MKPVTKDVTDKAFRNPNCKRNKGFFDGATPLTRLRKLRRRGCHTLCQKQAIVSGKNRSEAI